MRKRNGDSSQCETEIIGAKTTGSDQNTCVCPSRLAVMMMRATDQLLTRCNVKNYDSDINYDNYNSNDNNNGGGAFIT